ncbi:AMP-binding protein [Sporosarcina sp. FA9]|uniref:AMP-binding protein n=1 Tax=Sporosarcina sp. FA9 TaxID=3413030 RepID=UPI003F654E3A
MDHESTWILKRTALSDKQIALIDIHTGVIWTYEKLKSRILHWASYFKLSGYKKGERIAILAPNSPDLFAIMFACELRGLIYAPLNWRLSHFELNKLLEDCTPSILLFHNNYQSTIEELLFHTKIPLDSIDRVEFDLSALNSVRTVSTDPWMIIYTGGTTGMAKGVVLSKKAIYANAVNTIASWGLSEKDVTINYMPLFHTGGINALSMPLLMAGGTVVIGNTFDCEEALKATDTYNATISLFVPTMYHSMINTTYFKESSFPSMNVFISGGAPCPELIYLAFHKKGLNFKEGYGLTEAGPNNFFIRSEDSILKIGSVGKCMLLNSVKVLNKAGVPCGIGEVGELYIKGPHVFSFYWENQIETRKTLVNGWLRTGDLAKYDTDGDYYIVGRKKDVIITGGENVYPQEVEQLLLQINGISEVAVLGKEDLLWGEIIIAFISLKEGVILNEERTIEHCKRFLGTYKIPKQVIILPELPKTHVGKIDKKALKLLLIKTNKKA